MKRNKVTVTELESMTGVPTRFITDIRSDKSGNRKFELRYIIALAVGLKMTSHDAKKLVKLCGYHLRRKHPVEYFYKIILNRCGTITVKQCNALLKKYQRPPLTDL